MIAWTRAQPYCAGLPRSLKPVARPDSWGEDEIMAKLPANDGVIALSVDGAILRPTQDPIIATSGMSPAQEAVVQ